MPRLLQKTCVVIFLIKGQKLYENQTPTQLLSHQYSQIFGMAFFKEHCKNRNRKNLRGFPPQFTSFFAWFFTCNYCFYIWILFFKHLSRLLLFMPFTFTSYCFFIIIILNFMYQFLVLSFLHFWFQQWNYWYFWITFLWICGFINV